MPEADEKARSIIILSKYPTVWYMNLKGKGNIVLYFEINGDKIWHCSDLTFHKFCKLIGQFNHGTFHNYEMENNHSQFL